MANVIDFGAKRLAKTGKAHKPVPVTTREVINNAIDYLLSDWEKFARKNQLNNFFSEFFPVNDEKPNADYLHDLTAVADLESKIGTSIVVYFPGLIDPVQVGWVVKFKMGEEEIFTPDMSTECQARCFALLLYLKIKADLTDLNLF